MPAELVIPEVGESIAEVEIGEWLKHEGDAVHKDEVVARIETDKATVEVVAPESGVLERIVKGEGETAKVGDVIGYVGGEAPAEREEEEQEPPVEEEERPGEVEIEIGREEEAPAPEAPEPPAAPQRREEEVPMSPMRRRIAERLVEAQKTAALLTTFNEVDMTAVEALRSDHGEAFRARHGVKLGIVPFFVKALIEALKAIPELGAEIRDGKIVYKNYYDIGIAVGGGKGLVVPVLRDADRLSFAEIEKGIDDFARRAREGRLELAELRGGVFTISNGGVYGSLLSTPIVNPPQSGVLGLHVVQDRPVARDRKVEIRPMMYLALTYDHRIVDGREAVTFLGRVKECVEAPSRILLEI